MTPVKIPQQLIDAGFRFIIVKSRGKEPLEAGFPTVANYAADDPWLNTWISPWVVEGLKSRWFLEKNGWCGNYGVLGSKRCVGIDLDGPEIVEHALGHPTLRDTFSARSGSGRGQHKFVTTDGCPAPVSLLDPKERDETTGERLNVGHIKGPGSFVVGPGCIHPSGGVYEVVNPGPVLFMGWREILEHFKDYITAGAIEKPAEKTAARSTVVRGDHNAIAISDIISLAGMHPMGGGRLIGPHPFHGSVGKRCFTVDTRENFWHCFAHGSTGGALALVAMKYGIADCSDFQKGTNPLKGDKFFEAVGALVDSGIPVERIHRLIGRT